MLNLHLKYLKYLRITRKQFQKQNAKIFNIYQKYVSLWSLMFIVLFKYKRLIKFMADFSMSYFNDRHYKKLTKSVRVLTNTSVFNIAYMNHICILDVWTNSGLFVGCLTSRQTSTLSLSFTNIAQNHKTFYYFPFSTELVNNYLNKKRF